MNVGELIFSLFFQADTSGADQFEATLQRISDLGEKLQGGFDVAAEKINSFSDSSQPAVQALTESVDNLKLHFEEFADSAAPKAEDALKRVEKEEDKTEKNTNDVDREVKKVDKDMMNAAKKGVKQFTDALKNVNGAATMVKGYLASVVGGAVAGFVKNQLNAADSLNEWRQALEATYGEGKGYVDDFVSNAITQYGLAEEESSRMLQTIGSAFKTLGHSDKDVAEMSTNLVGLSADMAAFLNADTDQMFTALQQGMNGMNRSLVKLGVNLNDDTLQTKALAMGFGDFKNLSETQKQLVRYQVILEQTRRMQGGFADSLGQSWSNARKVMVAQIKDIQKAFFYPAVEGLRQLTVGLNIAIQNLRKFVGAHKDTIANVWDKIMRAVASAINYVILFAMRVSKLTNNFEGLRKIVSLIADVLANAMKLIAPIFAGILNVLDAVAGAVYRLLKPAIDVLIGYFGDLGNEGYNVLNVLADLIRELSPLFDVLGQAIAIVVDLLASSLVDALLLIAHTLKAIILFLNGDFEGAFKEMSGGVVQTTKGTVNRMKRLFTSLVALNTKIWNTIFATIKRILTNIFNFAKKIVAKIIELLRGIVDWIKEKFTGVYNAIIGFLNKLGEGFSTFLDNVKAIFRAVAGTITNFIAPVVNFFKRIWDKVMEVTEPIREKISAVFGKAVELIKNVFSPIVDWVKEHIIAPIHDGFSGFVDNVVALFEKLKEKLKAPLDAIKDMIDKILHPIKTFTNDVGTAISDKLVDMGIGKDIYAPAEVPENRTVTDVRSMPEEDRTKYLEEERKRTEKKYGKGPGIKDAFGNLVDNLTRGFSSGGVVGGTSNVGDKLLARVNSGEMILNKAQQAVLGKVFGAVDKIKGWLKKASAPAMNAVNGGQEMLSKVQGAISGAAMPYSSMAGGMTNNANVTNNNTFNVTCPAGSTKEQLTSLSKQIAPMVDELMTRSINFNRAMIKSPEYRREA